MLALSLPKGRSAILGWQIPDAVDGTAWVSGRNCRTSFSGRLCAFSVSCSTGSVTKLTDGQSIDLMNMALPTGKLIYILRACISDHECAEDADYDLEVYNITDAASIYATSARELQEGTIGSPLGSGASGDRVRITVTNNSGATAQLTAMVAYVVM